MRHGSNIDPPNRFETVHHEPDLEYLEWDQEHLRTLTNRKIEYIADSSRSIVSENNSPDIPFRYSLIPTVVASIQALIVMPDLHMNTLA